jgi:hypothetical protein
MKILVTSILLVFYSVQLIYAQDITSAELSKLSADINAVQTAAEGKTFTDSEMNISAVITFPKESFNVFFSSGFAYQAVYKNNGSDKLFVTENIDFSVATKVTAIPVASKSTVQCIKVSFPETVVTHVLLNGEVTNTIYENAVYLYCAADNPASKNKLISLLETLISKLAKGRDKYHTLTSGKLYLPDGIYQGGYTAGNRRANEGTMEYYDEPLYKGGWIYKGGWKNDRRHFEGTLTSKPAKIGEVASVNNTNPIEIYSGKWVNDVLQGAGKYEKVGQWKYEGNFVNGKMEGDGTSIEKNGSKYIGQWKNGFKEGKGVLTTAAGDVYDGEWKNGELNGQGTWLTASGDYKYVGGFRNGKRSGTGTLKEGANTYIGEWYHDDKMGKGEYNWSNGDKYIGEWSVTRNGKGIMYYANGDKYDGEWRSDKKSLQGTYTWHNGDVYTGEWARDTMNGEGTMLYKSGEKYIGTWKDGKQHGTGTLYDKNNNQIKDIGLDKPVLTTAYLRSKTEVLNKDKNYFINYLLTDSTFILYVPKNFSHTIYFDLHNDKQITADVDVKYDYVSAGSYYYRFLIKNTGGSYDNYRLLPTLRDENNIFELTFTLKSIVNLRRSVGITNPKQIAFQIYFSDGDKKVYLPKRKEELDFSKGNMYYIDVK